jgi:hypothetical protein
MCSKASFCNSDRQSYDRHNCPHVRCMTISTCSIKVVQHATASALNNQEATAAFLLLPTWMENSTNAFHKMRTDNKDVCTILGNIPKTMCATCHSSTSKAKHYPAPARSNMGHTPLSSLEQSCQGATYYKLPILVREINKTFHQQQSRI